MWNGRSAGIENLTPYCRDRKTPTTHKHALENKIPKPNGKQLSMGKSAEGTSSFSLETMGELWTARRPAGMLPTFAIVVGLSDLQKPEDAGHAAQTCMGV